MKKEQLVFLIGGLAFGFLVGFGVYHVKFAAPDLGAGAASTEVAGPSGPMAPTQSGLPGGAAPSGDGGAPMVAEINALKRRLESEPNDLAALTRLANLHHDVQMWPQAAGFYERAMELDQDNPNLLTDLGVCYRGMRDFDKALAMFERAQQVDPDHWQSLFNTVIVAGFDLAQWERAEAALDSVEALAPEAARIEELRKALAERRNAQEGGGAS